MRDCGQHITYGKLYSVFLVYVVFLQTDFNSLYFDYTYQNTLVYLIFGQCVHSNFPFYYVITCNIKLRFSPPLSYAYLVYVVYKFIFVYIVWNMLSNS